MNVTDQVEFGPIDQEMLPLTKCVCGATWKAWAGPVLSVYADDPTACPECGRRLYFRNFIMVIEVEV